MNRFGILHIPEGRRATGVWHNIADTWGAETYNYSEATRYPTTLWFATARDRDMYLPALAADFPGLKFAPIELTSISQATAGPVKTFSVSDRGVLPV